MGQPFSQDIRSGLAEGLKAPPPRPVDTFDIPLTMDDEQREVALPGGRRGKIRRLAFATLSAAEEKMALKRCGGDPSGLAFQLAISTLAGIVLDEDVGWPTDAELKAAGDGAAELVNAAIARLERQPLTPLSVTDSTADAAWVGMHPAMRNLCVSAYGATQTTTEDVAKDFLKSRRRVRT
jgi:hypothetical protein